LLIGSGDTGVASCGQGCGSACCASAGEVTDATERNVKMQRTDACTTILVTGGNS
jgi:hypothetical protein